MIKELDTILWDFLNKEGKEGWSERVVNRMGYEIFRPYFNTDEKIYNDFYARIFKDKKTLYKFNKAIMFYYHWCKRPSLYDMLCPEFKLIIIFSIVESLVGEPPIHFSVWLGTKIEHGSQINNKEDYKKLRKEYEAGITGSNRSVLLFIEKYFDSFILNNLKRSISVSKVGKYNYRNIKENREILNFIAFMRNEFVHNAQIMGIPSIKEYEELAEDCPGCSVEATRMIYDISGRKIYDINMKIFNIDSIMEGFEKGLLNFFKEN